MSVNVAIGVQDFSTLIENHYFYVDKTAFLKEWWDSGDSVTLITRPRRFGKTLNMSMLSEFLDCTKRSEDLFAGMKVSESFVMAELNKHPVIFVSFLNVKGDTADGMLYQLMCTDQGGIPKASYGTG